VLGSSLREQSSSPTTRRWQFALALPSIVFLVPHMETIASLIVLVAGAADKNRINDRKALIINMQKSNQQGGKAIVLVHGGFVDGSGWAGVYNILKEKGYTVAVVQNPTKSPSRALWR
jgi:hypothetical protein